MWLTRRARDSIEIEIVPFVGNQWWGDIGIIVYQSRTIGHEPLTTSRRRVCGRGLTKIPLANIAILGAGEEKIGRGLGDDPFDTVGMAAITAAVGIAIAQILDAGEEVAEPSGPGGRGSHVGVCIGVVVATCILDVEDTDLGITSTAHQRPIIGVRHEFDGKDVATMTSQDGRVQGKRRRRGLGLIGVDVQVGVIRARGQQLTGPRPAQCVDASSMTAQLVDDIQIVYPLP